MALSDSLPQINLGFQGETQGVFTTSLRAPQSLFTSSLGALLVPLPYQCHLATAALHNRHSSLTSITIFEVGLVFSSQTNIQFVNVEKPCSFPTSVAFSITFNLKFAV
ncbi:hypothetical protein TNCV_3316341 [Trichonephila clavipes]|nr:hypothetical protein TNCV_3316341 [Trichonephila clavipes]